VGEFVNGDGKDQCKNRDEKIYRVKLWEQMTLLQHIYQVLYH
jgi:hypothetical protein